MGEFSWVSRSFVYNFAEGVGGEGGGMVASLGDFFTYPIGTPKAPAMPTYNLCSGAMTDFPSRFACR